MHVLTAHGEQQRLEAAAWAENEEIMMHNVWFSDEAHFHLDSIVNKQNVRFWALISSHGLMRLVFFDQIVNSDYYLSMLHISSVLQLITTGLPFNTQWFMQDGTTPHTENVILDFLHDTFGLYMISHRYPAYHGCGRKWSCNSTNINTCNLFLQGYLKRKLFQKDRPQ